jgi:hypothetical protein
VAKVIGMTAAAVAVLLAVAVVIGRKLHVAHQTADETIVRYRFDVPEVR